jgi:type IV pilus assembly protein PilW
MNHYPMRSTLPSRPSQRGVTLIELMIALVLSTLIALAAVSALVVARQGFTTVDSVSQLRDNGRFVSDIVQRLGVQAGFKDMVYATRTLTETATTIYPAPPIFGFNNSTSSATDPLNAATARAVGTPGYGSDVLILRYQSPETFPGSGVADTSMIDCMGNTVAAIPADRDDRMASILHVRISQGEPALMCTTVNPVTGAISAAQPIIAGVESFNVLYGVDDVIAGVATPVPVPLSPASAASAPTTNFDSVPDVYLRADQLNVAGDADGTNRNWRRVKSLRIGMILRGAPGSQQQANTAATRLYPLGPARSGASAAVGSALSSVNDPGTIFIPPIDGRMRHVVSFTVHLRNDLDI